MTSLLKYIHENIAQSPLHEIIKSLLWSNIYNSHTSDCQEKTLCEYYHLQRCRLGIYYGRRFKNNNNIEIEFIKSEVRGSASFFLRDLCEYADKNKLTLYLTATTFYVGENNRTRLLHLYTKFGFVPYEETTKGTKMKRETL